MWQPQRLGESFANFQDMILCVGKYYHFSPKGTIRIGISDFLYRLPLMKLFSWPAHYKDMGGTPSSSKTHQICWDISRSCTTRLLLMPSMQFSISAPWKVIWGTSMTSLGLCTVSLFLLIALRYRHREDQTVCNVSRQTAPLRMRQQTRRNNWISRHTRQIPRLHERKLPEDFRQFYVTSW